MNNYHKSSVICFPIKKTAEIRLQNLLFLHERSPFLSEIEDEKLRNIPSTLRNINNDEAWAG